MGAALRLGALLVGLVLGVIVLGVVSTVWPGAWLPLAYAVSAGFLAASILPRRRAVSWWAGALIIDVFALWSLSVEPIGLERLPKFGQLVVPAVLAAAAVTTLLLLPRRAGWLWALLGCSAAIALVSSGKGSSDPMIEFFHRSMGWSQALAETVTFYLRKTGHFTFYGTVGLLSYLTARSQRLGKPRLWAFAALYPLLLACFDELRQGGYRSRTGSPWDVLLDMTGVAAFLWLADRMAEGKPAAAPVPTKGKRRRDP